MSEEPTGDLVPRQRLLEMAMRFGLGGVIALGLLYVLLTSFRARLDRVELAVETAKEQHREILQKLDEILRDVHRPRDPK